MNTRAQFEAMGLAIIVVLISLGLLVVLLFSVREETDAPERYRDQQLAQNIVDALLATSVKDCPIDIADLIEDVVTTNRNPCNVPSEELLKSIVGTILSETLEKQDYHYAFLIREDVDGATPILEIKKSCEPGLPEQETEEPGNQPITVYPTVQTYMILLYLCDT